MGIAIRALRAEEVDEADNIFRLAFGTSIGLPDPTTFAGDAQPLHCRWRADPASVLAAEVDGRLAGTNVVTRWGSFGSFGPLTVHPDLWDAGVASALMEPTVARFDAWGLDHSGLYTLSNSPKHLHLYGKFGYWPRFLTGIFERDLTGAGAAVAGDAVRLTEAGERGARIAACSALTDAVWPGLDVRHEIEAVLAQDLGDVLLLPGRDGVDGLAVAHTGPGSEAGSGRCYVKFAAVRPGPAAGETFTRLLGAVETFATGTGARTLVAGLNTARTAASARLLAAGFRAVQYGVAMQRPGVEGFNRPDAFVLDDWR